MDNARLAALLQPFLARSEPAPTLLEQIQLYLDLLLRWNARVNLTAARDPEQIVTRHFGESLFAAAILEKNLEATSTIAASLTDVGSGAGFPGIPIKLAMPHLQLNLIESRNKKATFLREALRTLNLEGAEVICERAERWTQTADIVTLRAVEQFESVLPIAVSLVSAGGRLCLLIGASQFAIAQSTLPQLCWTEPRPIPASDARVVVIARRSM